MQFKGKLMNQTLENDKKTNFGPKFDLFGPNVHPLPHFFWQVLPLLGN